MPDEASKTPHHASGAPGAEARRMLRRAGKAALATLDRETGHPYASLALVATEPDGAPVLLLSRLALHTQNIAADPRASLLIEAAGRGGDPLAAGRVSLAGRLRPAAGGTAARRFLAAHPSAAGYAGFADFGFFVMHLERAHYVGGFGRISPLTAVDLLLDVSGAGALIAAEPDLLAALDRGQAEKVARLGARLSGGRQGPWRVTGIDPAGCDLALVDERRRCDFAEPVSDAGEAWCALRRWLDAS
ncbi:MAG: pyridoxamine 5'-phosphate oxidase family protein [Hyphomicrobiaceae bacterium]|nr:pyridoxamine 5'-phosphate oxidase family protein [Hyphomicrobiaceae bacterium]